MSSITVDGPKILAGQTIIGEIVDGAMELNLAWMRLAGVGIKVYGDKTDQRRLVLDRQVAEKSSEVTA